MAYQNQEKEENINTTLNLIKFVVLLYENSSSIFK